MTGMTSPTADLAGFRRCETAEDYFKFFGLPYDPKVVNVYRLHILKHFAKQLAELHVNRTAPDTAEHVLTDYRDALVRSYLAFTTATAMDHRVFKVLQDHAPAEFVPAAQVTVHRGSEG